jgi:hypothetical protein
MDFGTVVPRGRGEVTMRSNRRRKRKVTTTVRGVVALADWSNSHEDAEVVLLTDDDEEYYIDASDSAIRLGKYINSRVEASGKVYERDERRVLIVRRIRVVESFQDFDGDVYGDDDEDDEGYFDDGGYGYFSEDTVIDEYSRYIRSQRDLGE